MKRNNFKVPTNLSLKEISTNYTTGLDPISIKKEIKNTAKKLPKYKT